MRGRLLAVVALALALVLAACGGEGGGGGSTVVAAPATTTAAAGSPAPAPSVEPVDESTAQLWITRDHGAEVLLEADVPSGLTVLQALDEVADIETRYGGRFVQAIDGVEGGLSKQRDWFYFLNGIEPDVGAAEIRLHPGDVAWWDFREWADQMEAPVVVGAFPEPFLHGFEGSPRPVEVRAPAELADVAGALEDILAGEPGKGEPNVFVLDVQVGADGATLRARRGSANDDPVTFTLSGSLEAVRAVAEQLVADPELVRFRYTATFDEQGRLIE
jgi:hypothetical protein